MNIEITGYYLGKKRVKLIHMPSGAEIITDAPKDNQGEGASFSPTDLVAASLGSCMMTIIAIMAERDGLDLIGMHMHVTKEMNNSPRRIKAMPVIISLPRHLTQEQRTKLERAASTCPVHHSLHPEIEAPVTFRYDV